MSLPSCTGIILAGGRGRRLSGANKAAIDIDGTPILDRIQRVFDTLFVETILVTRTPGAFLESGSMVVTDLFDGRSALTGIHAGLFYARTPYVFIAACDAPFIRGDLVALLLELITPGIDIVIPETGKGLEPLFAVYSRRCLEPVTRQLERQRFRVRDFFRKMRVRHVSEKRLRAVDPELVSFYNVNTPQDLAKARQMVNNQAVPLHPGSPSRSRNHED